MAITKVRVSNFKGFKDLEVDLESYTVLIGANASGKSSFIQIFQFIRDLLDHGLDNAISMQGGVEYLRNMSIGSSKPFSLEITSDTPLRGEAAFRAVSAEESSSTKSLTFLHCTVTNIKYNLTIAFEEKGEKLKRVEERVTLKSNFDTTRNEDDPSITSGRDVPSEYLGTGEVIIINDGHILDVQFAAAENFGLDGYELEMYPFGPDELDATDYPPGTILKGLVPLMPFFLRPNISGALSEVGIYDFDPRLPKRAVQIVGRADLEADGSNLALVLKNILEDNEERRKFSNLIGDVLPFVESLRIEKFADKSLFFELQESYYKDKYLPASLLSDGTINVTALIVALYFENNPLTIIEEPERNLHPSLIARVVDMMREVGQRSQIIVTTHSPELVKHSDLKNLLLVTRDAEGYSTITKPVEREAVRSFLEGEMGVEELYVRNLLAL